MLTIFRIVDTETALHAAPADLRASQFSKLYNHLLDSGIATDLDPGEIEGVALNFEFNANAVSLADYARFFAGDDSLLAVAEEAQLHGRSLRISKKGEAIFATLSVSDHITITPEIMMSIARANAVLKCLGINPTEKKSITIPDLRASLMRPSTQLEFIDAGLETAFDYLAGACGVDHGNTEPMLAWI